MSAWPAPDWRERVDELRRALEQQARASRKGARAYRRIRRLFHVAVAIEVRVKRARLEPAEFGRGRYARRFYRGELRRRGVRDVVVPPELRFVWPLLPESPRKRRERFELLWRSSGAWSRLGFDHARPGGDRTVHA